MKRLKVILAASIAVLAVGATPLSAQDLAGEWQFERQARNGIHAGTIIVDRSGRAKLRARGPVQRYSQCGYVEVVGDKVEIVFTSVKSVVGYSLDHFYCTRPGDGLLSCYNIDGIGKEDDLFRIGRVGSVSTTAAGRFYDHCPVRESPQV